MRARVWTSHVPQSQCEFVVLCLWNDGFFLVNLRGLFMLCVFTRGAKNSQCSAVHISRALSRSLWLFILVVFYIFIFNLDQSRPIISLHASHAYSHTLHTAPPKNKQCVHVDSHADYFKANLILIYIHMMRRALVKNLEDFWLVDMVWCLLLSSTTC